MSAPQEAQLFDPSRRALIAGLAAMPFASGGALAQLTGAPRRVPYELTQEALSLNGAAFVGARRPDVVMIEFFDYNCPWCRQSAQEMVTLLRDDPHLGYVLVNYAILGERSVEAARIALAYSGLYGHEKYAAFHLALFSGRGVVDGQRAFDAAIDLGAEPEPLLEFADSEPVTQAMIAAVSVGNRLGLFATPSFVVGPWAFDGAIPIARKRRIVADLRA